MCIFFSMVHFAGGTGAALFSSALPASQILWTFLVIWFFWDSLVLCSGLYLLGRWGCWRCVLFMFVFADPFHEVKRKRDKKKEVVHLSHMLLLHFWNLHWWLVHWCMSVDNRTGMQQLSCRVEEWKRRWMWGVVLEVEAITEEVVVVGVVLAEAILSLDKAPLVCVYYNCWLSYYCHSHLLSVFSSSWD